MLPWMSRLEEKSASWKKNSGLICAATVQISIYNSYYCNTRFLPKARRVYGQAAGKGWHMSYPLLDSPDSNEAQSTHMRGSPDTAFHLHRSRNLSRSREDRRTCAATNFVWMNWLPLIMPSFALSSILHTMRTPPSMNLQTLHRLTVPAPVNAGILSGNADFSLSEDSCP